ncbi:MAG: heme-binding protein [Gammaproteobacteria bacterium]|nr:heme-binding protein [Gammaproteobacteria bacterium]
MTMRLSAVAGVLFLCGPWAAGPVAAEDQPAVLEIKRLSMEMAYRVAKGAVEACRAKGVQVAATVVDRAGQPQAVLRDVLAMPLTLEVSYKKAYTATNFNTPTSDLVGRFEGNYSVGKAENVLIAAGGLPIEAGGTILGGVGVSGAPSGETDQECARAGLEAVRADLEMAAF